MQPSTIIIICGVYSLLLALFHLCFWKLFNWRGELAKLNFANRGIMQILNIQLTCYFLCTAYICFAFPAELVTTNLGQAFLVSNVVFWLLRTVLQFVFLRANHVVIHLLTLIFFAGAVLFAIPILK